MTDNKDELQGFRDEALKYYLGLWNLLIKDQVPQDIIIDAAINNMLGILDQYLPAENKVALIKKVLETIEQEHSISIDTMQ